MRRNLTEIISLRPFFFLRHVPSAIFYIRNWISFLLNYSGLTDTGATYMLRNRLRIQTGDGISAATIEVVFMEKDYGDPPPSNSLVIDLGANIGVYALYAAQSPGTIVYAYEPMPVNFQLLKENVRANGLEERIFCFPFAVAAQKEKRALYVGATSPLHSLFPNARFVSGAKQAQPTIEVDCIALQQIFDDNRIATCDLLKIDCEGAEYDILYHLPKQYFARIKEIRLEYHNHVNAPEHTGTALIRFLQGRGFTIVRIKESSPRRGDVWCRRIEP